MKNSHQIESNKSPSVLCPLCENAFHTVTFLDKHLAEIHNLTLKVEEKVFDSIEGIYILLQS